MPSVQTTLTTLSLTLLSLVSCVSTGKYKAMQQEAQKNDSLYTWSQRTLKSCQDANNDLARQKTNILNEKNSIGLELNASKENNTILRKQLSDLSALSTAQAESIRRSLDKMGDRDQYLQDLRAAIIHRDSASMAVLLELKATVGGFSEQDLLITLDRGTVYLDISDSLLFEGDSSADVTDRSRKLLGRLAKVLGHQPGLTFTIQGHADSIPAPQDSTPQVTIAQIAALQHMASPDSTIKDSITAAVAATAVPAASKDSIIKDSSLAASKDSAAKDSAPALTAAAAIPAADSATATISVIDSSQMAPPIQHLQPNGELSFNRAVSLARIFQHDYKIPSTRMTITGSSEQHRTRIIILPRLDQLLDLVDRKKTAG